MRNGDEQGQGDEEGIGEIGRSNRRVEGKREGRKQGGVIKMVYEVGRRGGEMVSGDEEGRLVDES